MIGAQAKRNAQQNLKTSTPTASGRMLLRTGEHMLLPPHPLTLPLTRPLLLRRLLPLTPRQAGVYQEKHCPALRGALKTAWLAATVN